MMLIVFLASLRAHETFSYWHFSNNVLRLNTCDWSTITHKQPIPCIFLRNTGERRNTGEITCRRASYILHDNTSSGLQNITVSHTLLLLNTYMDCDVLRHQCTLRILDSHTLRHTLDSHNIDETHTTTRTIHERDHNP